MSLHRIVARMFAELILHPAFGVVSNNLYFNDFFRAGQRLLGTFQGVDVYISESDTSAPSTSDEIARVLAKPDWLDEAKSIIYEAHRRRGTGIRIEVWRGRRWYQVFIPLTPAAQSNPTIARILKNTRPDRAA